MNAAYEAGQIISNYRLARLIGMGGFGEVWLAEHIDLSTEVAIKIPTFLEYVKQLRAEGKIQYELDHPNIVNIIDLNTTHDPPYCVMEYINGENLRQKLEAEGVLPPDHVLDIMRQILLALHEAHGKGFVHRDLKPENILLDQNETVRITDFGLGTVGDEVTRSILLSSGRSEPNDSDPIFPDSRISTGSIQRSDSFGDHPNTLIAGTYDYMSPEQKTGERVDARSDLYSVGVMLCELLTGSRPSGHIENMLEEHGVEEYMIEAILTALDEYDYRFESAADFLHALKLDAALREPKKAIGGNEALKDYLQGLRLRVKAIDGGRFLMGSNEEENERPSHQIHVEPFYMGIYPITASEYCLFLNEEGDSKGAYVRPTQQATFEQVGNGFRPVKGCENYPVNFVSWHGAMAFCEWLSRLADQEFSLPTEEQWEFAARAGLSTNVYPWGSREPIPKEACFRSSWKSPLDTLCSVDSFEANGFGLYGMAGNVWEWCREPFMGDYSNTQAAKNGKQYPFHVVRGGCWSSPANELRCSFRNVQSKGARLAGIGFRVARKA